MKTVALLIVFLALNNGYALAHPIHVTVTNIDMIADSGRLDYSIRLYYDDFQYLVNYKYNTEIDFKSRNRLTSREQEAVIRYISDAFQLIGNKNDTLVSDFLGWKKEDQTIWLLFCANFSPALEGITIRNTLLLDLYENQSNLIIFQHEGKQDGLEFDKRNTLQSITF